MLLCFSGKTGKTNGSKSNVASVSSDLYHVTVPELAENPAPTASPRITPQPVDSSYSGCFSHKLHEKKKEHRVSLCSVPLSCREYIYINSLCLLQNTGTFPSCLYGCVISRPGMQSSKLRVF